MTVYLKPKNKASLYKVFDTHPELLTSFLNALMPFENGRRIVSLEYLSPKLVPDSPAKRDSDINVICKDNYDNEFIVQVPVYCRYPFKHYNIRCTASMAYIGKSGTDDIYTFRQPVYILGLTNDIVDKETSTFYHHYPVFYCKNKKDVIEGLEMVIIEVSKCSPDNAEMNEMAVLWLHFLKEHQEFRKPEETKENDDDWNTIRSYISILNIEKMEKIEETRQTKLEKDIVKSFKSGSSIAFLSIMTDISENGITAILRKYNLIKK
jgi:hypothetical protein